MTDTVAERLGLQRRLMLAKVENALLEARGFGIAISQPHYAAAHVMSAIWPEEQRICRIIIALNDAMRAITETAEQIGSDPALHQQTPSSAVPEESNSGPGPSGVPRSTALLGLNVATGKSGKGGEQGGPDGPRDREGGGSPARTEELEEGK